MNNKPMIVHIVFRFDYGGLENGVANVINALSGGEFAHAIIALSEATEFRRRLHGAVPVYALGKRPGKDIGAYWRLFRLLRKLRPVAVHTRNIGTLDCSFVAFLARVPVRIHGEHGWDVFDPDGTNPKYRSMRRILSHFVQQFVTVSEDLRRWLESIVGISGSKITRICNGVDTNRFRPAEPGDLSALPEHIFSSEAIVIGCVTRFSEIKDPLNLIEAFIALRATTPGRELRLLMVGDGELREQALARLEQAGAAAEAWLPGSREDIPALMRNMDVFVLGSLREGISNTILEAMATGLPVVATENGGNNELIAGDVGRLVPPADAGALAAAIELYVADPELRAEHGRLARARAVDQYSITAMIENYRRLYEQSLALVEF